MNSSKKYNLDVWSESLNDIRLPPHRHDVFSQFGIEGKVWIKDLQKLLDDNERENNLRAPNDFFDAYRRTSEVLAWIDSLVAQFPNLLKKEILGTTTQGQNIIGVHLQSDKGSNKPRIVMNACQHAREWVTVTTNNWVLNVLLQGYGKNETITELVDTIDWTFIPIVNVDGYDFSWTNNRMWRKTRKQNSGSTCVGVDPNRNWPYMWNRGGSSTNPCSDTYHGPSAGSEPEPFAVWKILRDTPRVMGYIDVHSYSQLFMSPWGYSSSFPPDYSKMKATMDSIVQAIQSVHSRRYTAGSIGSILYIASGNAVDYAYGQRGILHSYTIELRDTGQYGFALPPNQIRPQGEEYMDGVIVFANAVKTEFYGK
jgi:carboxypeptidase A2